MNPDAVYVDSLAAREHVRSISTPLDLVGSISLPAVDVGAGDATASLARLIAGVSAFEGVLRVQLALASLALGAVIDDAQTADRAEYVAT